MLFSDTLSDILQAAQCVGTGAAPSDDEMLRLLERSRGGEILDLQEMVLLMEGTYKESGRRLILEFAEDQRRPHDEEILLLPPLYFSSICENNCKYCSFSALGQRLSVEEFANEFQVLMDMGYRSIELVSSQDPELYPHDEKYTHDNQLFQIDGALEYFDVAKSLLEQGGGGMLTSNIPPLDVESLKRLREAGLDCFLLWLETFQPEKYSELHVAQGPKGSQPFRLDSFEHALEAGLPHVAGAFLKGLDDWRKEEIALYCLDVHLRRLNGNGFSIIGTPRLKGAFADSSLVKDHTVSDEDYALNIALDRILFNGILWLQTRESFDFNLELMKRFGAGVILTLTSCTAPGGYSGSPKGKSQFPIQKQGLSRSLQILEEGGFQPHFVWDASTLVGFQRVPGRSS